MFPNTDFMHFADSLTDRVAVCLSLKESCEQNQRIVMYFFCNYKYTICSLDCFNLPGLSGTWIML